ncbi:hypothetical protein A3A95_04395 [Candidatus Nomurabacteria bacterium RIFCSPLOWO2_01_FULL_39_18]|uniref:PKD/Chitinase domain-containing protein n=1 Tax=Candidatus Nomurabacteria bacterium RIFCSPHIGHO2_01_FULL_40_24b TaxID=1801739 RepID=A0A1F6V5R9_9BACT|nr:MAG: hypothetical protein A2647_04130 [Candidatus Nomurabacteria bacterium RIFCSPHIGHO2_01_FULL_40_24b]OGI89336.1 MAG: hypothetical protein A3A95_04395 [Candidatus Nomurabacteria bacterium RIFCSPLOWO2_01_FULL_39_18]
MKKFTRIVVFVLLFSLMSFSFHRVISAELENTETLICNPNVELLQNGGFEDVEVTDSKKWTIFPWDTPGLGWTSNTLVYGLEIQAGYSEDDLPWLAHSGSQYAEIDGGDTQRVLQNIATIPGATYEISFAYSPRPHIALADNRTSILANDTVLGTVSADGTSLTNTDWKTKKYSHVATTANTAFALLDTSEELVPTGTGMFIDSVSVKCHSLPQLPQCSDTVDNDDPEDSLADANDPGCHTDLHADNAASYDPDDNNETNAPIPQCDDNQDNDGDNLVDTNDPGCHTDGNPDNAATYDPTDNDETNAPAPGTKSITMTKIVCPNETDLPNWSGADVSIGATTATDFITSHPQCRLEPNWQFQVIYWGPDIQNAPVDPGGSFVGPAPLPWITIPSTTNANGVLTTTFNTEDVWHFWVREVLKDGYIPFGGETGNLPGSNISAEMYCNNDVSNYDNLEQGDGPEMSFHCVAFNVAEVPDNSVCPAGSPEVTLPATDEDGVAYTNNLGDGTFKVEMTSPVGLIDSEYSNYSWGNWTTDSQARFHGSSLFIVKNQAVAFGPDTEPVTMPLGGQRVSNALTSISSLLLDPPYDLSRTKVANGARGVGVNLDLQNGDTLNFIVNAIGGIGELQGSYAKNVGSVHIRICKTANGGGGGGNNSPVANAGPDQIITLPSNLVQFNGENSTDSDGTITSYVWSFVSGPSNINPADVVSPAVEGGFVAGTYVFKLTVTDDDGATDDDEVTITVNPAVENSQCNDNIDNADPEDTLVDENDPGCHTDGNANNANSYNANDNDETDVASPENNSGGGGGGGGRRTRQCNDNRDNNDPEDTLIDEDDPGCHSDGNANNADSYVRNDNDEENGRVLGEQTSCGIYVEKYLRVGYKNDVTAVVKVQTFLNNYMNAGLVTDGVYGPLTEAAVRNFQLAHNDKVLRPWGIDETTGIFYLTTQTEMNNIMCPDLGLGIPAPLINWSAGVYNTPAPIPGATTVALNI